MVLPIPERWRAPYGRALCFRVAPKSLTPRLTGAGARSAEGTATGHENAAGMVCSGFRVEHTFRLWRKVEVRSGPTTYSISVQLHGVDLAPGTLLSG